MESTIGLLAGSAGSAAFFALLAFAVWVDYRKKKDESEAAHRERMRALELGHPPLDAEIARAKAYAGAAWAAGLIGLLVPLTVILLTVVGTLVALLNKRPSDDMFVPLAVAWSIAGLLALVAVVRSLGVIQRLPRPTGEAPRRLTPPEKPATVPSSAFEERISAL